MRLNASIPKMILYIAHIHSPVDYAFLHGSFSKLCITKRDKSSIATVVFQMDSHVPMTLHESLYEYVDSQPLL